MKIIIEIDIKYNLILLINPPKIVGPIIPCTGRDKLVLLHFYKQLYITVFINFIHSFIKNVRFTLNKIIGYVAYILIQYFSIILLASIIYFLSFFYH